LRGVSLTINPGEALALIGENGAGKSTLMKILSGAHAMDAGEMKLDGQPYAPKTPLHAQKQGVAMIYQELNLAQHLTVEENLVLGNEPAKWGWLDRKERRRRVSTALAELESEVNPESLISDLTVAQQQLIEIARALMGQPKVLILDEPTSSLTGVEVQRLFKVLDRLRTRGVSIIYISHFLEECQRVCSRFTVLRDGESVADGCLETTPMNDIIHSMVGREVKDLYPRKQRDFGDPVLELQELRGQTRPRSVSFQVREGEIFGLFGLIGAGRTETLRAVFGLDRVAGGTVQVYDQEKTRTTPHSRLQQGMALLSEDRKLEGLFLNRSIAENLLITRTQGITSYGFIRPHSERCMALDWMEHLDVRARDEKQSVGELSGGNQQKVAFGRLLYHQATILLLDEPTRGIDVGSKAAIYRRIGRAAEQGRAVVIVSSYLPELLGVCDTIGVMCRGELVAVRPYHEWDEHSLISAAIGQVQEASPATNPHSEGTTHETGNGRITDTDAPQSNTSSSQTSLPE
jgi:ribose transport system ATP-binding protein